MTGAHLSIEAKGVVGPILQLAIDMTQVYAIYILYKLRRRDLFDALNKEK